MAGAATALSLAATGLSAVGKISEGSGEAAAYDNQAQQEELKAQYGQIKAAQTSAYMQENLSKTLSNIQAVQSATGASTSSPSDMAIRNYSEFLGERDRSQAVANVNAQVQQDKAASAFYQDSAQGALLNGFLGGAGSLLSGAAGAVKSANV